MSMVMAGEDRVNIPSSQRPTADEVERAQTRVELRELIDSPGWKHIEAQLRTGIQDAMNILRRVDTADPAATVDAVQRWQLRHVDYENLCNYVNAMLAPEETGDDELKLSDMELILQEKLHAGTDHGPESPAGY